MKAADKMLAKRYARAYMGLDGRVFDQALEAAAKARITELENVFAAVAPYRKFLVHPVINGAVKEEILAGILGRAETYGPARVFLEFLVKENRFFLFEEIVRETSRLFEAWCSIMKAEVCSRYELGPEEMKRLEKLLVKASGKKVNLTQSAGARVLGGFEIKMGDLLIDATLKGRFERLKKELSAA
jgi:F-type H+-transporting ATPase subunit delta